jgi:hypothetical protein
MKLKPPGHNMDSYNLKMAKGAIVNLELLADVLLPSLDPMFPQFLWMTTQVRSEKGF